jgi:hypothetical protein
MLLLLAACGGPVVTLPDDVPVGHDSAADPGDSAEVVPPDTSETDDPVETAETAETGDTEPIPEEPDVLVNCAGGGDFTTIAAAIAASPSGTKIGLAPCTYTENVDFLGKSLDIFGVDGSAATLIQGTGVGSVVRVVHGESVGTRLAGVTISGGGQPSDYYGSGLRVDQALLSLDDVVFTANNQGYAVLYGSGASMELRDVTFTDNRVANGGMIAILDNGSLLAERISMDCTGADYGLYEHNSSIVLDSEISCGRTAAVYVASGELHLRRSRVEGTSYAVYGEDNADTRNERMWLHNSALIGGDTAVYALYMHVKARNDVFIGDRTGLDIEYGHAESYVHDSAAVASACGIRTDGAAYDLGWNAVPVSTARCHGDGYSTVEADPQFVDSPDDLHLASGSPLRDAGDPDGDRQDVDGSRNDIGIYGGPEGHGAR